MHGLKEVTVPEYVEAVRMLIRQHLRDVLAPS